jgi:protein-disulfide isomerase
MESTEVLQRIAADQQKGAAAGVSGTPTVFLDSNMLRYEATTPEGLRKGINFMLKRRAAS